MYTKTTPEKQLTEAAIIEKILEGDIQLFEILMRRYNELLYRTIRSYLFTYVEDTMQDTYIKAFEKLHQFKNDSKFSTWLIRIGINEALLRKRKSLRHTTISLHQDVNFLQLVDQNTMNPERHTIYKEFTCFLEKSIETLPEKYKIVYMLREIKGLEISEISKSLNLSTTNVKVRLFRARNMLRNSILTLSDYPNVFEFGNFVTLFMNSHLMRNSNRYVY